jgi:phosphopantothenoylcysteine decarboxylase/phosphopantothenate--cysteine ligase
LILYSVGPGPGAHAAPEIAREILRAGRPVEVVLEPGAQSYVGPAAFEGPIVEQPSEPPEVILFAPATPGTLARLARGLSQLAGRSFVAPDLDAATAEHPAVKENLALLRADGCRIVASRGAAGMAPAREVVARLLKDLGGPMSGLKVLVTAGGTREPIDSVRFIGNRSSGRMGLAVAREALRLGAEVSVVAANVEGREPGTEWAAVETVEELRAEVLRRAGEADALVMAAAVSDYAPDSSVSGKIRRQEEGGLSLKLKATPDILKAVRERYPDLFVVGFAATHGDPVPDAREKLGSKRANLVVGNDVSREDIGFGTDENEVYVVGRGGERFVPRASKESVARAVLESLLEEMRRQG